MKPGHANVLQMIYLFSMLSDKSNNRQLICLHFNDMMSIVIADKS